MSKWYRLGSSRSSGIGWSRSFAQTSEIREYGGWTHRVLGLVPANLGRMRHPLTTTNNNIRSVSCPPWLASLHLSFRVPRLSPYVSLSRASNVQLITPCTIVLTSLNDDTYTTHGHSLKKHTDRREQSSPENRLAFAVGDGSRCGTCHSLMSFYSWFLFDFLQ